MTLGHLSPYGALCIQRERAGGEKVEAMDKRRLRALLATGVLVAVIALALSACGGGGGGEEQKSATGGSIATDGQIAFRRWFDPDQTKGALFAMNPDGSHVRQITHPPKGTH